MNKKLSEKKYLSTAEVAKILGISRIAVFRRIRLGKIKAEKIGKSYMILKDDISIEITNTSDLSNEKKREIETVVKRAAKEYGEAFKLLGKE
jgi:excisionase family DNA binding protein